GLTYKTVKIEITPTSPPTPTDPEKEITISPQITGDKARQFGDSPLGAGQPSDGADLRRLTQNGGSGDVMREAIAPTPETTSETAAPVSRLASSQNKKPQETSTAAARKDPLAWMLQHAKNEAAPTDAQTTPSAPPRRLYGADLLGIQPQRGAKPD